MSDDTPTFDYTTAELETAAAAVVARGDRRRAHLQRRRRGIGAALATAAVVAAGVPMLAQGSPAAGTVQIASDAASDAEPTARAEPTYADLVPAETRIWVIENYRVDYPRSSSLPGSGKVLSSTVLNAYQMRVRVRCGPPSDSGLGRGAGAVIGSAAYDLVGNEVRVTGLGVGSSDEAPGCLGPDGAEIVLPFPAGDLPATATAVGDVTPAPLADKFALPDPAGSASSLLDRIGGIPSFLVFTPDDAVFADLSLDAGASEQAPRRARIVSSSRVADDTMRVEFACEFGADAVAETRFRVHGRTLMVAAHVIPARSGESPSNPAGRSADDSCGAVVDIPLFAEQTSLELSVADLGSTDSDAGDSPPGG